MSNKRLESLDILRGFDLFCLVGLEAYTGDFYPALIAAANAAIVYLILRWMYRQQVFLKV